MPLYAEIQRGIETKIATGEWGPGTRIPSELELVEIYKCSRMTVNKALSSLGGGRRDHAQAQAGLLRGAAAPGRALMHIQDIRAEILAIDRTYSFEISNRSILQGDGGDRRPACPRAHRHPALVHGGDALCRQPALHHGDPPDQPRRAWCRNRAPPVQGRAAGDSWLLKNVSFSEGEHSIRAISADAMMAKKRRWWSAPPAFPSPGAPGSTVTSSPHLRARLIYPGDRHRFVVRFTPSAPVHGPP